MCTRLHNHDNDGVILRVLSCLGVIMKTCRISYHFHYSDFIMGVMASQITSLPIVFLTVYSGADQRKHQSSASLAFVRGIHQ